MESLDDIGVYIRNVARVRWLFPEEIFLLLVNKPECLSLEKTLIPPQNPLNGEFFLYEEGEKGLQFKYDQLNWAKKKTLGRIQETTLKLKINGTDTIRGIYCKGAERPNFKRRVYRLIKSGPSFYHMVHYRECPEDEKPERPNILPAITNHINNYLKSSSAADHISIDSGEFHQLMEDFLANTNDNEILFDSETNPRETTQSTQSFVHMNQITILDFLPNQLQEQQNDRKMLICLSNQVALGNYSIRFSNGFTAHQTIGELIQLNVLRCVIPIIPAGSWKISIFDQWNNVVSICHYPELLVLSPAPLATPSNDSYEKETQEMIRGLGKRMQPFSSPKNRHHGHGHGQAHGHGSFGHHNSIRPWMNNNNNSSSMGTYSEKDYSDTVDREHKIRIVEKLGQMKNALLDDQMAVQTPASSSVTPYSVTSFDSSVMNIHSEGSGHNDISSKNLQLESISMDTSTPMVETPTPYLDLLSSPSNATNDSNVFASTPSNPLQDGMEWLDDTQLSSLSNNELEVMMDRYIMDVVKQLVTLATVDDELIAEIDSLDILLARGIEVNHVAADGSTGLHLAVGAGHYPIVQSLLESGAKVLVWNEEGMTPYDIAIQEGDEEMKTLITSYYTQETQSQDCQQLEIQQLQQLQHQPQPYIRSSQVQQGSNNSTPNLKILSPTRALSTPHLPLDITNGIPRSPQNNSMGLTTPGKKLLYHDHQRPQTTPEFTNILLPPIMQTTPPPNAAAAGHNANTERDTIVANKALQDAFASLSLTDKCALSISMGQFHHQQQQQQQQSAALRSGTPNRLPTAAGLFSTGGDNHTTSTAAMLHDPTTHMMMDIVMHGGNSLSSSSSSSTSLTTGSDELVGGSLSAYLPFDVNAVLGNTTTSAMTTGGATITTTNSLFASINEEDISDIQSVISETDKESLGKAMSLMGHAELLQVEEEVKKIQNNVRGWLLRKNYMNLREAAKVLQTAWREKRKLQQTTSTSTSSTATGKTTSLSHPQRRISHSSATHTFSSLLPHESSSSNTSSTATTATDDHTLLLPTSLVQLTNREERALATLQAATRRMIANKKSFISIRKQTMASMIIQKRLMHWWTRKHISSPTTATNTMGMGMATNMTGSSSVLYSSSPHLLQPSLHSLPPYL